MTRRGLVTFAASLAACGGSGDTDAKRDARPTPTWRAMADTASALARPRLDELRRCEDAATVDGRAAMMSSTERFTRTANDADGDGLSDAQEARLCTFPGDTDSDDDGLHDGWEVRGVNGFPLRGASPRHRDVFVWMDAMGADLAPSQDVIDHIVAVYERAPVSNLDGRPGITLHLHPGRHDLAKWSFVGRLERGFFEVKGLPPRALPVYHYMIWALQFDQKQYSGTGIEGVGGPDFIVTLGSRFWAGGSPQQRVGTFLHELGHSLGLRHGGKSSDRPLGPNHLSIMNELFQNTGVWRDGQPVFTYQDVPTIALDERSLDEHLGVGRSPDLRRYRTLWNGMTTPQDTGAELDWDGVPGFRSKVEADLDGDRRRDAVWPAVTSEWDDLAFDARNTIGSHDSFAVIAGRLRSAARDYLRRRSLELAPSRERVYQARALLQQLTR